MQYSFLHVTAIVEMWRMSQSCDQKHSQNRERVASASQESGPAARVREKKNEHQLFRKLFLCETFREVFDTWGFGRLVIAGMLALAMRWPY